MVNQDNGVLLSQHTAAERQNELLQLQHTVIQDLNM